jgi:chemosensory pili system protein ChpA (sensor histidine kinase/response regulator)
MDAELLQGFIEEAESYMPTIRSGIELYAAEGAARLEDLQTSYRQVHTIKGAALMVGLAEIGAFAKVFQDELDAVVSAKAAINREKAEALLSRATELKAMFANLDATPVHIETETFNFEQEEIYVAERAPENAAGDFEIDNEMLEVFALEAEEHLRNITTHLNILEKNPNHYEALMEIRRSSHTLKGSAGIVGFKKLSDLAHVQEDLLDYIAENPGESNAEVFNLLNASTDCLEALSTAQNSPELDQKIAEIHVRFAEVLAELKAAKTAVAAAKPTVEETILPAAVAENAEAKPEENAENAAENQAQAAGQTRAVIRVSLERLDELVKLASEMIMSRSVFEQRLSQLEQQVEELRHNTRRLSRLSGKFETDFGANAGGFRAASPAPLGFGKTSVVPVDTTAQEFDVLEFDRYTEFHQMTRELTETASDTTAINNELGKLLGNLNLVFGSQKRLFEDMQDKLLRLRMVPLSTLAQRLQRTVRVTADEEGKEVDFFIEGDELEIDSEILHVIVEPILHLLRNAVAHGIESPETRRLLGKPERGQIMLRAYSEGTHIVFTVTDDGRGISTSELKSKAVRLGFISPPEAAAMTENDAFSLIFLPGLSTAPEVNQVSGRGVGMNVVKSSLTRHQGSVSVKSEAQKGTNFTLRMPTSLSVTRVLLVKACAQTFAFPLKIVRQVTEISQRDFLRAKSQNSLAINGKNYQLVHLNELLNLSSAPAAADEARVLLLLIESPQGSFALAVEQIMKPEEIVIKPLGNPLRNVAELIGATILGDGSVVPVLDLISLLHKLKPEKIKPAAPAPKRIKTQISVMIVDDSPSVRAINSNTVRNAGWRANVAKDGLEAFEMLQSAGTELPDVILTDVEMPRMDGYELLAAVKREPHLRQIPVIMITSRTTDKHRRKAFDLGVSEYLTKPYDDTVLTEKIKSLAKMV